MQMQLKDLLPYRALQSRLNTQTRDSYVQAFEALKICVDKGFKFADFKCTPEYLAVKSPNGNILEINPLMES